MEKKEHNDKLKALVEKNIEISQEILGLAKYFKKYIFWRKVFTYLRIILILVPLIIAFVYLPPFLRDLLKSFQALISPGDSLLDF